jgi:glycosyltransferase involved in cell wall biosynthesis
MISLSHTFKRLNSLSVFFPAYNDEASIPTLVIATLEILPKLADDFELIVINDGSTDGTGAAIDRLALEHERLRVVHHPANRGYGGALQTGFATATKDWIFYTDGDGQYDVRELASLVTVAMTDCAIDVVNGYKRKRSDAPQHIIRGELYKLLASLLFNLPIRDVDCDFRLIKRQAMHDIELVSTSGVVCAELVYKLARAGALFFEVPVHHYPRLHGQSQFLRFGA